MEYERLMAEMDPNIQRRVAALRLMIFDVDGVLTDGRVIYLDNGSEVKEFDVKDGHGIKLMQRAGIDIALITGRFCKAVQHRADGLGITRVYQGIHRKIEAYETILKETGLADAEVGYMGDDLIDIPVMRRAGFAVAVPEASSWVLPYAHYVTQAAGGRGAAREVCELILQGKGLWESVTTRYFGESS